MESIETTHSQRRALIMNTTPEQAYESLKTGKEQVVFMLSGGPISHGSEFGEIVIRLAFLKDSSQRFNDSLGFYDNHYGDKNHYKGLTLQSDMNSDSSKCSTPKLSFHTSVYQKLDLDDLESMTKAIRPILRKLQKISDQEGRSEDLPEMAVRLGRVLKVKSFYVMQKGGIQWERNDDMSEFRTSLNDLIASSLSDIGYIEKEAA